MKVKVNGKAQRELKTQNENSMLKFKEFLWRKSVIFLTTLKFLFMQNCRYDAGLLHKPRNKTHTRKTAWFLLFCVVSPMKDLQINVFVDKPRHSECNSHRHYKPKYL